MDVVGEKRLIKVCNRRQMGKSCLRTERIWKDLLVPNNKQEALTSIIEVCKQEAAHFKTTTNSFSTNKLNLPSESDNNLRKK